jgi:hypothetical protein
VLPAATDTAEIMVGESYATEIRKIPFADNIVERGIANISEHLCDQLIDQHKTSLLALQADEATYIVKDAYVINYVW